MRFREVSGPSAKPGTIEVHIIAPGRGSSGYYTEDVLKKACEAGVYPAGQLMHWDHPTRQQEEDQPARVTGTIAAAFVENAQYREEGDPNAWDGPGPYALAEVRPKFREDLKWLAGKIGVSHYVDGRSKEALCPDGKKGRLITEIVANPFNSVDFVTVPGAGGHSRFNEVRLREEREIQHFKHQNESRRKMADKQLSIRLSELMTNDPEVVTEIKKQLTEELKLESLNEAQKTKLTEAKTRIRALESENETLKGKIAEKAVREYAATEIGKAKLPETVAKNLLETIVHRVLMREVIKQEGEKWVVYTADGEKVGEYDTEEEAKEHEKSQSSEVMKDPTKIGAVVTEAIKAKQAEIAAILKESGASGVHDNGVSTGGTPDIAKAREAYRDTLVENGMNKMQADRLAGIEVKA